jgi:alpha-L-rhamnosidase
MLAGCKGREMFLKRRDFLIRGAAAAAAPVVVKKAIFAAPAVEEQSTALGSAQIICCARSVPVPIQSGGSAEGIASSSDGLRDSTPDLHSVFAKEFTLGEVPSSAILHLFAFTRYRLYVNGDYIGRGPSRYQNQRPEYDCRDVRQWLQAGRNILVILVHRDAPTGRIMRHDLGLIAVLELMLSGKQAVIATDSSWLSMPELSFGPRAQAWSSIEESIDARKTTDWTRPDLTQPVWQSSIARGSGNVPFFPRSIPLQLERDRDWTSKTQALPIDLVAGNEIEFSLPEIAQAFHRLEMDAEEGSALKISYALPQGEESGKCTYVARGGLQTWMGGDTFAFLRLRLRVAAGHIRLTRAAACEVRYPFERAASFACSDPFLTQLWEICARSLEVLSEDSYVDCADRERVEWTDDSPPAFDCTRVMMRGPNEEMGSSTKTHWGDSRLLGGLLRRIALTQQPDGQLKAHSCSERFDIHAIMEDRTCDWVVLLREYLESSGDADLVRALWPTLTRLLDWYRKRRTARGLVLAREWEVWDNPLRYQVCEGAGLNAMVHRALVDASALARIIGNENEAEELRHEAQQLQVDFNRLLWNEREAAYNGALFGPGSEVRPQQGHPFTGKIVDGCFGPTAQANLFALYSGIVPSERIDTVRRWILLHLDDVRGPMSHYYLFRMLYEMEDAEQDARVLQLMKTGWKNQVDSEWQTTWEDLEESEGSKVHIYGMHPGYFLTAFVLGARREGPLERRTILIEPRFSGINWARGVCVTEFGPVKIEWRIDDARGSEIVCTAPDDVKTKLRLPLRSARGVLEVDGKAAPGRRDNGWVEIELGGGQQTIRWQ